MKIELKIEYEFCELTSRDDLERSILCLTKAVEALGLTKEEANETI
jgi:hypothetical protein